MFHPSSPMVTTLPRSHFHYTIFFTQLKTMWWVGLHRN